MRLKQKKQLLLIFSIFISSMLISPNFAASAGEPPEIGVRESAPNAVNVGILATACSVTVLNQSTNVSMKPDLIVLTVASIKSTDQSLSNFPVDQILNDSHLPYASFSVIETLPSAAIKASGTFKYNNVTNTWGATLSTAGLSESSSYAIRTNFTTLSGGAYSREETSIFAVKHYIKLVFALSYDATTNTAKLLVTSSKTSFQNKEITTASSFSYSLRDHTTDKEVGSGDLTYDTTAKFWKADISMKGLVGQFYLILTCKTDDVLEPHVTKDSVTNLITTQAGLDAYLVYIILIAAAIVGFLIIILVSIKKKKNKIERAPKKEKQKAIKVIEISKSELKKTRLTSPKKKKVKKMDENALIFNVPTWEVEEEEEEIPTIAPATGVAGSTTTAVAPSPAKVESYTLHCPGCNSWYELDEFEKIECPKCDTVLEIAMWCTPCAKWFDVPEIMEVNCPICNDKLGYSK
jgi:hypothetical protein